ncbi:hypothetical protein Hdeb2414_s0002g00042791 [Helianthus debilis subsp. tardiflorus]
MFFKIITGTTGLLTAPIPARMGSGVVTNGAMSFSPFPTRSASTPLHSRHHLSRSSCESVFRKASFSFTLSNH